MKNNFIKKYGINKCNNKRKVNFFKQFSSREKIVIPCEKLDVEEIVSVIVDPEIISLRVVDTIKGYSSEGQHLTGKKLVAEIKLRQKVMYIADVEDQSIHVVENTYFQSEFIVIPPKIKGTDPEILLNFNLLQAKILVEEISVEKINKRNIGKTVHLLMEVHLVSTYEICHTEDDNCTNSNLYIIHDNGTKKKQLTFFEKEKIYSPKWSPCGKKIAFLLKNEHKNTCSLCVTPIVNPSVDILTDPYIFNFISSYSWANNSNKLYFSSYFKGAKDIFEINLQNMSWKQLTYSREDCKNYKPKSSPNGETIAYLKSINKNSNLYLMKSNGLGTKKLTSSGGIKDFDWCEDSSIIAYIDSKKDFKDSSVPYITSGEKNGDSLYLLDIASRDKEMLPINKLNLTIKKVLFSPDNNYLAFIGKSFSTENIYLYDLLKHHLINLTNNDTHIQISDFEWKIDSSMIYYGANDLTYFNIYSIDIKNKEKIQISNTTADKILLSYRPKIR